MAYGTAADQAPDELALSTAGRCEVDRLGTGDLVSAVGAISPQMAKMLVDGALGDVLARPDLDTRTRELLALAMLASTGAETGHVAVHARGALGAGASATELVEVIMQVATFAGFPRALSALSTVSEELAEVASALPVPRSARAVVIDFFDAVTAGDVERAVALVAPDVVWMVPGDPATVPWVGERRGRDAVREFYSTLGAETERESFALGPVLGHGETAMVRGEFAYRFPRTGGRYAGVFVLVFTVRDGLVVRYEMHEDSLALAQAFQADT